MNNWLETIPEHLRDTAREAASAAFGAANASNVSIETVMGGASGALTYRLELNARRYLLRLETRRSPLRNPHQYTCMHMAAESGIAPPVRYADDAAGVVIMDFIAERPLTSYPGGPAALA